MEWMNPDMFRIDGYISTPLTGASCQVLPIVPALEHPRDHDARARPDLNCPVELNGQPSTVASRKSRSVLSAQ